MMTACPTYKPPFPYFGGKSLVAHLVWARFGTDVSNYVEPFFGGGATLFRRPLPISGAETVNDADGLVANFWRALQADPDAVASYADWPVNENDLHARHAWLVGQKDSLQSRLEGSPDYYDARIAGWWCWGMCCWIGAEFSSGKGPWHVVDEKLVKAAGPDKGYGVHRERPHLGDSGKGVNRQRPHLGDSGRGVNRPSGGNGGIYPLMRGLADRLRNTRVCCGDWSRVCGPTVSTWKPINAFFLDPPYSAKAGRDGGIYRIDSDDVAHAVREWAIANGDNPRMRIALCGFDGEHEMPESWEVVAGKSGRGYGYGGQNKSGYKNAGRERIWFSPHCLRPALTAESLLFDAGGAID